MRLKQLFLGILGLVAVQSYAQLTISGELRPRAEYQNDAKTLNADATDPALFVSQRTRINTEFKTDAYTFFVSMQDVRTWGDVKQLADNGSSLSLHQAWGQVKFAPNFSVRVGRQEIILDDSRIFGNVGWAQQARSHDAAVFKLGNANYKLDLGVAYNQDTDGNTTGTDYNVEENYKAMQYAWFHKDFNKLKASFLFLNNGLVPTEDANINYSQTYGTYLKFKASSKLNATFSGYYQGGEDKSGSGLSAFLVGLDLGYKANSTWSLGLGFEMQSGNAYDSTSTENKAFTPFYGTNHKFNGFMDYFYVGNHKNSVGLVDLYLKASAKLGKSSSITAFVHNFSAQADIAANMDKALGTEIDLVYKHKVSKDVSLSAGYSQMFAQDGLEYLKGNTDGNTNDWGWIMLTIKPSLFISK